MEARRDGPAIGPGDGPGSETGPDGSPPEELPTGGEIQGKEFGGYRLLRKIAKGAVGIVYEALQKDLNRVVALKVLLAGDGASEEEVRRFHIEATAAAKLDHPCIVPIHEVGVIDGRHFFTMDYIKGTTLSLIIEKAGLPIREALILTKKVAEGLDYAHGKGIIHRDVKPANIIIDHLGNPRITDFGIAKVLESDNGVTRTGQMMGTPTYMSPEQAMGRGEIDGRADVYSLGAVLYELLTSRPPFESENSMDLLIKSLKEEPTPPRSLNPTIHRDVETICLKALEKDRRRRYPSAREMSKDIERYINGETILARPIGWWERIWRGIARHKTISASAAVALLAIFGIFAFAAVSEARAERARVQKVQSHIEIGRARMGDGDLARAKLEFEKALAIDPQSRDATYGIEDVQRGLLQARDSLIREGDDLFDRGEYGEADGKYREALRIDRESKDARRGINETSKALVEIGKTDALRQESEGLLKKGILLAERARQAPLESAGALYPEAIILIRQAAARDPVKDPVTSKTLGALFDLLLEYAAVALARESFEMSSFLLSEAELLGNDPERVGKLREEVDEARRVHEGYRRYLNLGRKRLAEGDFRGAIPAILQAMKISETQEAKDVLQQARYEKGMSEGDRHSEAGDWEEAHLAYQVALANASDGEREAVEAKCSNARGEICSPLLAKASDAERGGNTSEARGILNKVLQIDPSHRLARSMLADLEGTEEAPPGTVYIPGGEFSLASDLTGHKEVIGSFYIDRFEVTNRQFQEFVKAGGYERRELWDPVGWEHISEFTSRDGLPGPSGWTGGTYPAGFADHPVAGVSWHEGGAYARWRGGRLPLELEWEKAASWDGNERREFPWGETWDPSLPSLTSGETRSVGETRKDQSPFGVRDLGGNVSEWTTGAGDGAVIKGGSYRFPFQRYVRCAYRGLPGSLFRSAGTGFRCVRDIGLEKKP